MMEAANSVPFPFLGVERLSKYDMSLLSPNGLLKYKRHRKTMNERSRVATRKVNIQNGSISPPTEEKVQQKKTRDCLKVKKRYLKIGSIEHNKNRKKAVYCNQANATPALLGKRRLAWCKQRKNQRRRYAALKRQEVADLEARNQIAELQERLSVAETNLDKATSIANGSTTTDKMLGMLTNQVASLKAAMFPVQHLIQCHQAGPDHGVYDVDDDAADFGFEKAVGHDSDDDDTCVIIERDSKCALARQIDTTDGKTTETAHQVDEDEYDPGMAEKELQKQRKRGKLGLLEQVQRCELMLQLLPRYADARTWATISTDLSLKRSTVLATRPLNAVSAVFCSRLASKQDEILCTIITYKYMVGDNDLNSSTSIATSMHGRDFGELLQKGAFITNATIYFFSALLLQRDHAMSLAYPTSWVRSWIYGVHFYTKLITVKNTDQKKYQYLHVNGHGKRVPDGDIFALDRLMIPINITDSHFFTICVYMQLKTIQVVDSLPNDTGRREELDHILQYLIDEHKMVRPNHPVPDWSKWKLIPANHVDNSSVPRQCSQTNDCGIFTCLFMDYLMLKLPLHELTQQRIRKHGRKWLCSSILNKAITF